MLQAVRYLLGSPGATGFGSKSTAEEVTAACPDLGALTAIITGATSGIGAETARVLAKRGARVVIPARNVKAAEDMRARILADGCPAAADVLVLPLDLSSLASVRAFADRFLALGLPLHLLMYKQCRQVLARPARALRGRRRDDLRHKLSWSLPADEAAAGADGGDGGGDGRAGPHRQRVVQRPRMVRRRLGRVPPPRHPPQDTLRRDAGVRGVQARQRAAHPRARRAPAGNGRQRDGELRPPGHRQDPPQPGPRRRPHRSGVLAAVQAAQDDPSGCGDHVLRGDPPEGGRRVRPLLRRLQRGASLAGRHQPQRGRTPLAHLRGHHRRPPPPQQHRRSAASAIIPNNPGAGTSSRSRSIASSNSLTILILMMICLPPAT